MAQHSKELKRALDVVGDKWSALILLELAHGTSRFSTLQDILKINNTTLVQRLNTLAGAGLISKTTHKEYPPRIEYTLTEKGKDVQPVLQALAEWVRRHLLEEHQRH